MTWPRTDSNNKILRPIFKNVVRNAAFPALSPTPHGSTFVRALPRRASGVPWRVSGDRRSSLAVVSRIYACVHRPTPLASLTILRPASLKSCSNNEELRVAPGVRVRRFGSRHLGRQVQQLHVSDVLASRTGRDSLFPAPPHQSPAWWRGQSSSRLTAVFVQDCRRLRQMELE